MTTKRKTDLQFIQDAEAKRTEQYLQLQKDADDLNTALHAQLTTMAGILDQLRFGGMVHHEHGSYSTSFESPLERLVKHTDWLEDFSQVIARQTDAATERGNELRKLQAQRAAIRDFLKGSDE